MEKLPIPDLSSTFPLGILFFDCTRGNVWYSELMNNRKEGGFFFFLMRMKCFPSEWVLKLIFHTCSILVECFLALFYTFDMGNTQVCVFSKGQTHRLHLLPALWKCRFVLTSWVISHTRYWKENLAIKFQWTLNNV